jgi:hypothetical protein
MLVEFARVRTCARWPGPGGSQREERHGHMRGNTRGCFGSR